MHSSMFRLKINEDDLLEFKMNLTRLLETAHKNGIFTAKVIHEEHLLKFACHTRINKVIRPNVRGGGSTYVGSRSEVTFLQIILT